MKLFSHLGLQQDILSDLAFYKCICSQFYFICEIMLGEFLVSSLISRKCWMITNHVILITFISFRDEYICWLVHRFRLDWSIWTLGLNFEQTFVFLRGYIPTTLAIWWVFIKRQHQVKHRFMTKTDDFPIILIWTCLVIYKHAGIDISAKYQHVSNVFILSYFIISCIFSLTEPYWGDFHNSNAQSQRC